MSIIEEGQASKELLDNPLLQDTLSTIESALIEQWQETKTTSLREEIWYTLQGMKRFNTILHGMVERSKNELAMKEKFNAGN